MVVEVGTPPDVSRMVLVGLTVMVKVLTIPVQPNVEVGVTVIVAVTGVVPALVAVKLGILPVPAVPSPIDGLLFVQVKNTPGCDVVKVTGAVGEPLHNTWLAGNGGSITGVGLTVIVPVAVILPQPPVNVTV